MNKLILLTSVAILCLGNISESRAATCFYEFLGGGGKPSDCDECPSKGVINGKNIASCYLENYGSSYYDSDGNKTGVDMYEYDYDKDGFNIVREVTCDNGNCYNSSTRHTGQTMDYRLDFDETGKIIGGNYDNSLDFECDGNVCTPKSLDKFTGDLENGELVYNFKNGEITGATDIDGYMAFTCNGNTCTEGTVEIDGSYYWLKPDGTYDGFNYDSDSVFTCEGTICTLYETGETFPMPDLSSSRNTFQVSDIIESIKIDPYAFDNIEAADYEKWCLDGCGSCDLNKTCSACEDRYLEKDGECIPSANGCGAGYKQMENWCNRIQYTPAEAAKVLTDDNNNSVTITFRK